MLLEISCDKFIEKGQVRPVVRFHKGLNVVLGTELRANSIGKSTFLLIIDFVFGGNDYVKKALDVEKNIGSHKICFAFEFNNQRFYFSRSTQNFQCVQECDEHYMVRDEITIDKYKEWLSAQYQVKQEDLTFRALITRFFRIYQRDNLNEKRPLSEGHSEKGADIIILLEKIFGQFEVLRDAQYALSEAKGKKQKFDAAQKENFIPTVHSQKEYKECEAQRDQLSIEQESFTDIEALQSRTATEIQRIYDLKSRLQGLRCQNTRLGTKISQINSQLSGSIPVFQDDFHELEKYFNSINVRKIEEIEQFHKKLSKILRTELEEELKRSIVEQKSVTEDIKQAEEELYSFDIPSGISRRILQDYAARSQQIDIINTKLENYDKLSQLKNDVKEYQSRYDTLSESVLAEIEKKINEQMCLYNDFIYNGSKEAPVLKLTNKDYDFQTINDSGTGTSYKSLIIFDLSFLKLTNLPAIVHDSLIFDSIGDEPLAKIIELYTKFSEKQIFIAIDKASSYHSPQTQNYLEHNTVLRLSSGTSCLFGRSWSDSTRPV